MEGSTAAQSSSEHRSQRPTQTVVPYHFEDVDEQHLMDLIGELISVSTAPRDGPIQFLIAHIFRPCSRHGRPAHHPQRPDSSPSVSLSRFYSSVEAVPYPSLFRALSDALTRFHSRSPPGISVLDYLARIVKYANVDVSLPSRARSLPLDHAHASCFHRRLPSSSGRASFASALLPPDHLTLYRPNLHPTTQIHHNFTYRSPFRYRLYYRLEQGALRRILHQRPLCQSRRHQDQRTQPPRARVPYGH